MSKNIIVTGASGNVGKMMVQKLSEAGYQVIAISRSEHTFQSEITHLVIDLANDRQVELMVDEIYQEFAKIDAVICTAGGFAMGSLSSTGKKELEEMFLTNFETAYYLTRHIFKKMMTQSNGGLFVYFGAKAALEIGKSGSKLAYALSKSLVHNLANMINELGKEKKISSYVIAPGTIDTEENRNAMPSADRSDWVTPSEIVKIVSSLIEKNSDLKDEPLISMG